MSNRSDEPSRSGTRANDRDHVAQHLPAMKQEYESHQLPPTENSSNPPTSVAASQPLPSQRGFELPPLPSAQAGTPGGKFSPSVSRLAGVASLLNQSPTDDSPNSRRRKASELESNGQAPSLPPLNSVTHGSQPSYGDAGTPPGPPGSSTYDRAPRRILTPKSPSSNRPTSLNQMMGSGNAQPHYAPGSPRRRGYTTDSMASTAQPLPTPPAASQRHSYGFPGPISSAEVARRVGATHGPGPTPDNTSPTTSYSPYSQADVMSPATHYAPHSMPTLSAPYQVSGPGTGSMTSAPRTSGPERQRPAGIPISSAGGPNVFQMMTLETTSGTVQLPVDVQAASRVADEKRRRNAGASARFRERRKMKERENNITIKSLETRLKEMADEVDFYKRERDYLANVLKQTPGGEQYFPRPNSPVRRRRSSSLLGRSSSSYVTPHEDASRSPEEGRRTKRRTSGLTLPPPLTGMPPQSAVSTPGALFHPGYTLGYGSQYSQHAPGQQLSDSPVPRGSYPSANNDNSQGPGTHGGQHNPSSGPPQIMHAQPSTGPWNPYAQERRGTGTSQDPQASH